MKKLRTVLLLLAVTCAALSVQAQPKNRIYLDYIDQYKGVAMDHQRRYKIPASITLSQGLLESGAGRGTLARQSNNHFGIKCHDWKGAKVYHDDDLKGECFRKYKNPAASFEDHSLFLKEKSRYSDLFKLSVYDYKGWARGLQKAGYATDKAYASKLINLIEIYELHKYDRMKGGKAIQMKLVKGLPIGYEPHQVFRSGDLLYVAAREGDKLEYLAKELGFREKSLAKYNEIPRDYPLSGGDIVFLQKKNKKADKRYLYHTVKVGESIHSISQLYGIQMKYLYKLNKKSGEYAPAEGDVLRLR